MSLSSRSVGLNFITTDKTKARSVDQKSQSSHQVHGTNGIIILPVRL